MHNVAKFKGCLIGYEMLLFPPHYVNYYHNSLNSLLKARLKLIYILFEKKKVPAYKPVVSIFLVVTPIFSKLLLKIVTLLK